MASKEYHREWRRKNPEKVKAASRRYVEKNRDDPDYRARRVAYTKKWVKKNKQHKRDYMREYAAGRRWDHIQERYGVSFNDFVKRLELQNGVCAICKQDETAKTRTGKVRRFAVDHCHKTNRFRGILCGQCNTALGLFQDDIPLLLAAVKYLQEQRVEN